MAEQKFNLDDFRKAHANANLVIKKYLESEDGKKTYREQMNGEVSDLLNYLKSISNSNIDLNTYDYVVNRVIKLRKKLNDTMDEIWEVVDNEAMSLNIIYEEVDSVYEDANEMVKDSEELTHFAVIL